MTMKKLVPLLFSLTICIGVLAGCSSNETSGQESEVQKVKIAYAQDNKPINYTDENGEPNGYDVEVMKQVDELLPEYEFEFIGTTDDDLLIGVQQGKYQVGIKNAFMTDERKEKFIYPEESLGLSSTGLVLRKEDEDIQTLADFASAGYQLAPIAANNAQYTVIDEYNQNNPDNQVKLEAGDTFSIDIVQWVNEERVDGGVMIESPFKEQVMEKDGPYHQLKDDVVYNEFDLIETWPLFNGNEQELADAYDEAIKELKDEKEINEISKDFHGRDLFEAKEKLAEESDE